MSLDPKAASAEPEQIDPNAIILEDRNMPFADDGGEGTQITGRIANMEVTFHKRWWGFELHCNQPAVDLIQTLRELILKVVSQFLPPPLPVLVSAYVMAHDLAIKMASQGHGCKLVSPWIAPLTLVALPLPAQPGDTVVVVGGNTAMRWTVAMDLQWKESEIFPAHHSAASPALAEFQGRLYCAHRGGAGDERLWWTVYESDTGWSADQQFPNHFSASGPALAVFQNKLYCAYRGRPNDERLSWATFDGTRWSTGQQFGTHSSGREPALAVFRNRLYCVYRGAGSDERLYWTVFDGNSWMNPDQKIGTHSTSAAPALAVWRDQLYCVYRGGGSNARLWWTTFDGNNWANDSEFPKHNSNDRPALAIFGGILFCVYLDHGTSNLWMTRIHDVVSTRWSDPQQLPSSRSAAGPALISFRDKYGTEDQLLCVHRSA